MLALALRDFTSCFFRCAAMFRQITCKIRHCLHNVTGPASALGTSTDCLLCDAVQGLAADMVQASTADAAPTAAADATAADAAPTATTDSIIAAASVGPIEANKGSEAGGQPDAKLPNEEVHTLQAPEATTPAGSASAVKADSTARKSGSQTWFGKAGGILGRWTVPVKVKKEPKSRHRGVTETIDLS